MTAGVAVAVIIVGLIIITIICIGVTAASDPTTQKEIRYQEYKAKMDKAIDLEKEFLEFAERYKREKEDGD